METEKTLGEVNGHQLVNGDKVHRAIYGNPTKDGAVGGVGEAATDEAVLVEYDRLGGLIKKDGEKVKTGAFYDFKLKAARPEPVVVFEISVDGKLISLPENAPVPKKVLAARLKKEADEEDKPSKKK